MLSELSFYFLFLTQRSLLILELAWVWVGTHSFKF